MTQSLIDEFHRLSQTITNAGLSTDDYRILVCFQNDPGPEPNFIPPYIGEKKDESDFNATSDIVVEKATTSPST